MYVACVPLHKVPWTNKPNLTGGPPYCPAAFAANAPYTESQRYAIPLRENCPQKRRCFRPHTGLQRRRTASPSLGNNLILIKTQKSISALRPRPSRLA